jgi:hypothetical protein
LYTTPLHRKIRLNIPPKMCDKQVESNKLPAAATPCKN